jgi:hypothetical protein
MWFSPGEQPHLLPRQQRLWRRRQLKRQRLHHRLLRQPRLRDGLLLLRCQLPDHADQRADLPLTQLGAFCQLPASGGEKTMQAPLGRQTFGLQK